MNNPTPEAVAAVLALVDAAAGDSMRTWADAKRGIAPFLQYGETHFNTAARILAAEVRRLKAERTEPTTTEAVEKLTT